MKTQSLKLVWWLAVVSAGMPGWAEVSPPAERETIFHHTIDLRANYARKLPSVRPLCETLGSLEKRRVAVEGAELYVETEGQGIPLVLINGGPGGTHEGFHPEFSRAAGFARVIYYDQRGCGLSDYRKGAGYTVAQAVADLDGLRAALQLDRWVVLGWSYGGYLAQQYLAAHPEHVQGVVLVGASPALQLALNSTRQYDFLSEREKQKIAEIAHDRSLSPVERIFNSHLAGDWKRQNYSRPSLEELARGALFGWKHDPAFREEIFQHMPYFENPDRFHGCPIGMWIAEGRWDLTWNEDKPKKLHRCFPGAELMFFEQSGHAPFQDEPELFFRKLRDFLAGLPAIGEDALVAWKNRTGAADRAGAAPVTNISDTVTFLLEQPAPADFDAWSFYWPHPTVDPDARVGYVVRSEDGREYYRWGPRLLNPGDDSQSDFWKGMEGTDPALIAGKKIAIEFWTTRGKLQFPEDLALKLVFQHQAQAIRKKAAER